MSFLIELEDIPDIEVAKRLRQAFSQMGGKSAIARKLIAMYPPHRVYVEAFAGGAACYFKKDPSPVEVLADLSPDVIFIYRAIQSLSDEEIASLQGQDWILTREKFNAFRDKYRAEQYASPLDKLYTILYLRHGVFGSGDPSKAVDVSHIGRPLTIAQDIPDIRARLQNTKVFQADARQVIKAFDSPDTFFYLDPPYPGGTSQRKDYAYGGEFSIQDLMALFEQLSAIRGKFLMSIPALVAQYVPSTLKVDYIDTPVLRGVHRIASREIFVTNYEVPHQQTEYAELAVQKYIREEEGKYTVYSHDGSRTFGTYGSREAAEDRLREIEGFKHMQKSELEIVHVEKAEKKHLIWVVVMKPYFVDYERQWATPETIMDASHRWMLKGCPVWLEHKEDISDKVKAVQSWILPEDWNAPNGRTIPQGSWMAVLWVIDEDIWGQIEMGQLKGGSVRGWSKMRAGSPEHYGVKAERSEPIA